MVKALPKFLNILSPVVHSWTVFARQIGVPSSQISLIRAANPPAGRGIFIHVSTMLWSSG